MSNYDENINTLQAQQKSDFCTHGIVKRDKIRTVKI